MLYKFIQELRKKQNWSQEYVASKIGISRPTYIQLEMGKHDITIAEAEKLANLFNIFLVDLLQEKEGVSIKEIKKEKKEDKTEDTRISVPEEKVEKFKEILLYILKKVGGKPNVGMTVIYKLLYFIDFDYYEKYEQQLMGLIYFKNHHGPTPPLFEYVVNELIKDKKIEKIKSSFYEYPQTKYLINPETKIDLSILNGQEQEHIDWELQRLSDMTASDLSELSHKDVPWISAKQSEQLDYEGVFYRDSNTSVRIYKQDKNND